MYHQAFIHMLEAFKSIWEELSGHMTTVTYTVELDQPVRRPVHSILYQHKPRARDYEKNKLGNMLSMNGIEPYHTIWPSFAVFALEMFVTFRICVDYLKHNVVTVKDSYFLPRMVKCIHA